MKYDLAKSSEGMKDGMKDMIVATNPTPEKEKGPSYPTACLYDLPKDLKGIDVGDTCTLTARVKSLRVGEKGVENLDLEILSLEDTKQPEKKKKKPSDEEEVDKGLDEASKEDKDDEEEDDEY